MCCLHFAAAHLENSLYLLKVRHYKAKPVPHIRKCTWPSNEPPHAAFYCFYGFIYTLAIDSGSHTKICHHASMALMEHGTPNTGTRKHGTPNTLSPYLKHTVICYHSLTCHIDFHLQAAVLGDRYCRPFSDHSTLHCLWNDSPSSV